MKIKLFLSAALAACLGLLVLAGCEKNPDTQTTAELLSRQWTATYVDVNESGNLTSRMLFDIDAAANTIEVGAMNDPLKEALEKYAGMDVKDNSFGLLLRFTINRIDTESPGEISCTVKEILGAGVKADVKYDPVPVPENEIIVYFSDLTAESVTLSVGEMTLECTATSGAEFIDLSLLAEEEEGEEPDPEPGYSIINQWTGEAGGVKQCFDIGAGVQDGLLIGQFTEGYETMLPEGADPEKSYISMVYGPDQIKEIVETDATSGTVIYLSDMDGDGVAETEMELPYANLTETSVDITYIDPLSGSSIVVSCTVAPEGTKVYTLMDIM